MFQLIPKDRRWRRLFIRLARCRKSRIVVASGSRSAHFIVVHQAVLFFFLSPFGPRVGTPDGPSSAPKPRSPPALLLGLLFCGRSLTHLTRANARWFLSAAWARFFFLLLCDAHSVFRRHGRSGVDDGNDRAFIIPRSASFSSTAQAGSLLITSCFASHPPARPRRCWRGDRALLRAKIGLVPCT